MRIQKSMVLSLLLLFFLVSPNQQALSSAPYQIQPYEPSQYVGLNQGRDGSPTDLNPKEIYGSAPTVGIRIANGGAGYTGLLRALSDAYLAKHPTIEGKPFSIAWYATNTTYSYHALRNHIVDVALIYEIWPEALKGKQSYGQKLSLLFNDAFIFVGPESNPARIIADTARQQGDSIDTLLEKIILTGCRQPFAQGCSMYLSRSDLSGTYMKETGYLINHRTPYDLINNSPWYYPYPSTPKEALQEASQKGMYTLNDKSTWVSHPALQQGLKIYADGTFGHDLHLLNPCYGLLAKSSYLQSDQPLRFLQWMRGPEGRKIIATYGQKEFGAPVVKAP